MSETIEYTIKVDANAAQRGLAAFRASAVDAGGYLPLMQKEIGGLQQKLGPMAAAISGVSSALGESAGEAGKWVAAGGQMAAAFGVGGVFGVGIVATTLAFNKVSTAVHDADENSRAFTATLAAMGPTLNAVTTSALQPMRDAVKSLSTELRDFGKDARQIQIDNAQASIEMMDRQVAGQERSLPRLNERLQKAMMREEATRARSLVNQDNAQTWRDAQQDVQAASAAIDLATGRIKFLKTEREAARNDLAAITRSALELDAKETERERKKAARDAAVKIPAETTSEVQALIAMHEKFNAIDAANDEAKRARAAKSLNEDRAAWDNAGAIQIAAEQQKLNAILAINKVTDDAIYEHRRQRELEALAFQRSLTNDYASLAQGSFGLLMSTANDYFEAKITGAENAEALAAAAFLKGVGQQLVGIGIKQEFEGAGMLIASAGADPRGYALLGLGGAAILAGSGMGAGGAAIAHTAAGGAIGQPLPDKTATNPGATTRGLGSSFSSPAAQGGGLNITIVYGGVSGPTAQDGVHALSTALKLTDKLRGGAGKVTRRV